jgi:hypothetical protein
MGEKMENKETIVTLKGLSEKESKNGRKYHSIDTEEEGTLTCFEKPIVDELQKHFGKRVKVKIVVNDKGFKNLREFVEVVAEEEKPVVEKVISAPQETNKPILNGEILEARILKDASIYTSYAKDVFICLCENKKSEGSVLNARALMESACDLVKQARDNFK